MCYLTWVSRRARYAVTCATTTLIYASSPSEALAQNSAAEPSKTTMEVGIDVGVLRSNQSVNSVTFRSPFTVRMGWLDANRRVSLEYRLTLNDYRTRDQESGRSVSAFQVGYRLRKVSTAATNFAGPFVFAGGGVASLRGYVEALDVPRFRFLPGIFAGIGARKALRDDALRIEVVAGYDHGYSQPQRALYVPARSSIGLRFGYSSLNGR